MVKACPAARAAGRKLTAATMSVGGPGAAARAGVPGAARAGVDVEQTKTVVLEAAHGLLAEQETANVSGIGGDAEVDGIAGQMVVSARPPTCALCALLRQVELTRTAPNNAATSESTVRSGFARQLGKRPSLWAPRRPWVTPGAAGAQACNHLPAWRRRRRLGGFGALGNRCCGNGHRGHRLGMPAKARACAPARGAGAPVAATRIPRCDRAGGHADAGGSAPHRSYSCQDVPPPTGAPRGREPRLAIVGVLTHVLDGIHSPSFRCRRPAPGRRPTSSMREKARAAEVA